MNRILRGSLVTLLLAVPLTRPAAALDQGRLEPTWFDAGGDFREADEIDYLWVRPGTNLEGKKLRFAAWPEPVFLGKDAAKRDAKDMRLARQMISTMSDVFADSFRNAFGNRISVVDSDEDIRVEGRIVDCSTGATAAKMLVGFGAGAGNTTVDLKFVDARSGEVLVAIHHRSVSGTSWSTTDSKFVKWVDEMTEEAAKKGFEKLYAEGDRVRK